MYKLKTFCKTENPLESFSRKQFQYFPKVAR